MRLHSGLQAIRKKKKHLRSRNNKCENRKRNRQKKLEKIPDSFPKSNDEAEKPSAMEAL